MPRKNLEFSYKGGCELQNDLIQNDILYFISYICNSLEITPSNNLRETFELLVHHGVVSDEEVAKIEKSIVSTKKAHP